MIQILESMEGLQKQEKSIEDLQEQVNKEYDFFLIIKLIIIIIIFIIVIYMCLRFLKRNTGPTKKNDKGNNTGPIKNQNQDNHTDPKKNHGTETTQAKQKAMTQTTT